MLSGFTAALLLITISELGDKTFFIAVVLSMRHPRRWVLAGVVAALVAMTVLSVLLGQAVSFLPKIYLHFAEIALFIGFGVKLLFDAWKMSPQAECDIIAEAETAVDQTEKDLTHQQTNWAVLLESFTLTFVAEWGDRTQIATIALAASNHAVGVTLGAIAGHTLCALIAVVGGKLIAGKISERTITAFGGLLFLIFAIVAAWEGY
jgi:Ca2+/H+ antiporter, TMEM165/GDT1 family